MIKITRKIILIFAGLAALPPIAKMTFNGAFMPKAATPPTIPVLEKMSDDWRVEVPRRPRYVLPVRWETELVEAANPERMAHMKNKSLSVVLEGQAKVLGISEVDRPYPGLLLLCSVEGNIATGKRNPYTVALFAACPESIRTSVLQAAADGKGPGTIDLAQVRAMPFLVQKNVVACVVASNTNFSQAWDWEVESQKLKTEFANRILAAKTPEEEAKIKGEIETKRKEGYDL